MKYLPFVIVLLLIFTACEKETDIDRGSRANSGTQCDSDTINKVGIHITVDTTWKDPLIIDF